jgi:hypothetical protein
MSVVPDRAEHKRQMMRYRVENMARFREKKAVALEKRICFACQNPFEVPQKWVRQHYCVPCAAEGWYARLDAANWVARAIRSGVLMRADQFRCADCANWATAWEHRDYSKPLQVEPVCDSCNARRGPGYRGEAALPT